MSPGVYRPLTERRHFTRAVGRIGHRARCRTARTLAGRLTEVDRTGGRRRDRRRAGDAGLKGRKPVVGEPVRVPLSEVRDAHVEVDLTGIGPVDDDEAGGDADAGQES